MKQKRGVIERDRGTEREGQGSSDVYINRETCEKDKAIQRGGSQRSRQTNRGTDRQTGRQTERQIA